MQTAFRSHNSPTFGQSGCARSVMPGSAPDFVVIILQTMYYYWYNLYIYIIYYFGII